jgi:hypothetical protein
MEEYTDDIWLMIRQRARQELWNQFRLEIKNHPINYQRSYDGRKEFVVSMHDGDYDAYSLMAAVSPFKIWIKRTWKSFFPFYHGSAQVTIINHEEGGGKAFLGKEDRKLHLRKVAVANIPVFGSPLPWSLRKCGILSPHYGLLPLPIATSLEILTLSENMAMLHLFQMKGNQKVIKDLTIMCEREPLTSYIATYMIDKEKAPTVYDVAGVLKAYLKELPYSLFTDELLSYFVKTEGSSFTIDILMGWISE